MRRCLCWKEKNSPPSCHFLTMASIPFPRLPRPHSLVAPQRDGTASACGTAMVWIPHQVRDDGKGDARPCHTHRRHPQPAKRKSAGIHSRCNLVKGESNALRPGQVRTQITNALRMIGSPHGGGMIVDCSGPAIATPTAVIPCHTHRRHPGLRAGIQSVAFARPLPPACGTAAGWLPRCSSAKGSGNRSAHHPAHHSYRQPYCTSHFTGLCERRSSQSRQRLGTSPHSSSSAGQCGGRMQGCGSPLLFRQVPGNRVDRSPNEELICAWGINGLPRKLCED